jgi:hypothetical protein
MAGSKFDPQPPNHDTHGTSAMSGGVNSPGSPTVDGSAEGENAEPRTVDFLSLLQRAMSISRDYQTKTIEAPLSRAYRAWNNQHSRESKYLGTAFKGRSRLFVPKTRTAVRKNLATAAGALFSTEDVVGVSAAFEDDVTQRATAATIKEDMNHRMTVPGKSGLPWFLISMGGCLDAQLTGVTISKQFWEYKEIPTNQTQIEWQPGTGSDGSPLMQYVIDPETGHVAIDPETGDAMIEPVMVEVEVPVMKPVLDRPMIEIHPIENVGVDPAAPWYSPAQLGRWWYVKYPMGLNDAKAMLKSGDKYGHMQWLQVSDETLLQGREEDDRTTARRVREGGQDRYEDSKGVGDLDIIWVQENFMRIDGEDYHWWSVGHHAYLSEPRPTREVYPELGGERPYTMGIAQIDTHRIFPMSPVEAWQPLQLELNDVTNLRQDTLKRSIAPIPIVRRGKNVDRAALMNRGRPETVVEVDNIEDVNFVNTPGPNGAAFTETAMINSNFDELAGVFSTSSVQSNRQLNETVGGMRLMTGAANAVSEFDLRTWLETWVEPTLRHVMHLVRFNESDERLLAIAGGKARALAKYQYMPTLEDFEQADVILKVNAGVGSLDPMQVLSKLRMAMEMLAPMFPIMKEQGIIPDMETIVEEVFGRAGFKDGRRFFKFGVQPEEKQDPELLALMEELKVEREKMAKDFESKMAEIMSEERQNLLDNKTKLTIEDKRERQQLQNQVIGAIHNRKTQERGFADSQQTRKEGVETERQVRQEKDTTARRDRQETAAETRKQRIGEVLASSMGKAEQERIKAGAKRDADGGGAPSGEPGVPMDKVMELFESKFGEVMDILNSHSKAIEAMTAKMLQPPADAMQPPPAVEGTAL